MRIILFSLFIAAAAKAEYRAFELVIANKVTGTERIVLSSLDPDQYRGYHALDPNETITYRDTWMCRGNTSDKQICPKPERPQKKPSQGPDSKSKKP
jgi:hypothetical protein